MLRVWLCSARKETGESMASLLLAHNLTTLRPVWWIFSVSWSTAMLLGAHTSTGLGRDIGYWINLLSLSHAQLAVNKSKMSSSNQTIKQTHESMYSIIPHT